MKKIELHMDADLSSEFLRNMTMQIVIIPMAVNANVRRIVTRRDNPLQIIKIVAPHASKPKDSNLPDIDPPNMITINRPIGTAACPPTKVAMPKLGIVSRHAMRWLRSMRDILRTGRE